MEMENSSSPSTSPPVSDNLLSSTESLPSAVTTTAGDDNNQSGDGPLLLREWSDPPVAPAVVVETTPDDNHPISRLATHLSAAYPVANLVRDFVRTGLDQMMLPATTAAATAAATSSDQPANLSIRSEPATYTTASAETRASAAETSHDPYTVSARTIDELESEGQEYIIVDGDLIAVPSSAVDHYDDEDEPPLRKKACRKGRMHRGFRKVRKFFARKKNPKPNEQPLYPLLSHSGEDEEEDHQQQRQQYHQNQQQQQQLDDESVLIGHVSPSHSPRASFSAAGAANVDPMATLGIPSHEHPVAAAAAARANNFRRQSSLGETSTHSVTSSSPNRKDKRKNKVSWKKQPSPANNKTNNRRFGNRKKDDSATATTATANVDQEDDRKPRSRPSRNDPNGSPSVAAASASGGISEPFSLMPPTAAAAAASTPLMPAMTPIQEALDSGREQSVTASLIGTADEPSVLEAGMVLPAAEAFIEGYYDREFDEKLKRDDAIPASLVPTDTDYKVDKEHAPDVEAMLRRAEQEAITDLDTTDPLSTHGSRHGRGKTAGVSVPLSQACPSNELVHNDNLKVVLVGSAGVDKSSLARAIRQSAKKPRNRTTLGVEVHTWTASDIRFHLWDVQGATHSTSNSGSFGSPGGFAERGQGNISHSASAPNFGAHPGTQSLFFSSQSLYLLVWDLACNNPHTHPVLEDVSDDEDDGNEWSREEANKQADRALQEDIENRVLSWVDRIARRGPRSAILPVALIPDEMKSAEAQRRCDRLYELLEARMAWYEDNERAPNVVLDDSKNILCVNYSQNYGIEQLQETMVAIATDTSSSVFTHVGTPVPHGVVEVLDLVKRVKDDHKLIWLDHIIGELGSSVAVDDVINALHFLSSIGEILYFGTEKDDVLSQFVVLSRKWLVSAISCILRNDLKRELTETRRFMNMQCIYSEQQFAENDATRVLGGGTASSCPLLSGEDARMLWQSMSFMREAADRYWQLNESSASAPTMFYFLERLLVNCGILLPLGMSNYGAGAGVERDEVFFVPSLLAQNDPSDVRDIWTYRSSESWTTTLCHSWLFRDGAPSDLFEHLTVTLLKGN